MTRIVVKHDTLLDDNHESLLERVDSVMEIHRNSGHRIVALLSYETISKYAAKIFYEYDSVEAEKT